MPGTGHSGRYRGSISNRNGKPAFQVLAPWNSRKNGEKGQVAISQGTDRVKFQNLDAQQMANYNAGNNTFNMNNNFTVAGGTTVAGATTLNNTVTVNANINQPNNNTTTVGTLNVLNNATYNQNLTVGGNFTVSGTTTTVNSKIVDISDSIIKVNDVHCDQKGNKSHGVLFEYNSQHEGPGGNSLVPQNGFFGVQRKIGPDINTHTLGADNASGSVGVFTYYTKDISDNSGGALQLTDGSFNIPSDLLGDALFNNLDLCGNLTGYNTFQIKNGDGTQGTIWMRANDISMNAVNNIDITGGTGVKLTEDSSGAYIDISGGNIDIAGATSNKISLVANGNILLNSNYGTSSNIEIHNNQGASANAIALTATAGGVDIDAGTSVTIDAAAASNFTTTAGILTLDGAAGVDISGNAGTVNITTTGTVDINAGPLDISASTVDIDATSSVTIDAAAASNFTTTGGALTLAATAANVDIDAGTAVTIDAAAASNFTTTGGALTLSAIAANVDIDAGTAVTIDAGAASNFTTTAGILTLDGASGVDISGNAGTVNITTTGTVDINAGPLDISASTVDIDATSSVTIDAAAASNFTTTGGALTLSATTANVDIDAGTAVTIDAGAASNFTTSSGALTLNGASGVNIAGNASEVDITTTGTVDINAGPLDIDSSAGVSIDAGAASNFTTSSGALTLNGASGVNIAGNASEVDITTTGTVDINAGPLDIDSSAGVSIDAGAASNFTTSSGALTLNGASGVNIAGNASEVDITTTGTVDINAGPLDIDASNKITITSTANVADAITVEATAGGIDILASGGAGEDIDITATGSSVNIKSTEGEQGAITMCATLGEVQIDGAGGVNIGTNFGGTCATNSVTFGSGSTPFTFNGDISANGDINAAGQTGTFGTVVTDQLNLLNNFTIGNIGSGGNNYILFGPGATIGNGIMNYVPGGVGVDEVQLLQGQTILNNKHSINMREDLVWISQKGVNDNYTGTGATETNKLIGGSLVVDGNMLFGAARGRTGKYDQGAANDVQYGATGLNQHRLLDMNCNDISGIRILSFSKTPIGNWTSDGTNDHTDTWADLSGCDYGLIDLACGVMVDISGLYFCDNSGSSITAGNSLDVSSNAVHFFNNNGLNNILVDISGIFQVGGADNTNGPVLKVMYTQVEDGSSSAGASDSTARIKTTNTAQNAIALTSTAGGILNTYNNSKNFIITDDDGTAVNSLIFNGDPTPTSRTITLTNGRGTGEDAITLTSTVGGVDIDAAIGKDVDIAGGQVAISSKDDTTSAISLTTNVGTSETIVVTNTQGDTDAAIALTATAGGITNTYDASKNYTITDDNPITTSRNKLVFSSQVNNPAGQVIQLQNGQGTDNAAINIIASAGGITNQYDASQNFLITDNAAGANDKNKLVFTGNSTPASRTIALTNGQGTANTAIAFMANAGGIYNQYDASKLFQIRDDDVTAVNSLVFAGDSTPASRTITLTNGRGEGNAAIALTATAGGITMKVADEKELTMGNTDGDAYFKVAASATAGSEDLRIVNTNGTDNAAIALTATAGGVDIDAGTTVTIDSTTTTAITGGTGTTVTATTLDLTLEATAESVNIKTGTNKPIKINGNAGDIGSVLTSLGSLAQPVWSMDTTVPIGAVMMWTTGTAPTNWAICDGGSFTTADYPTLSGILGGGNVPDMKGLFVRGFKSGGTNALGATGGQADNKIGTNHLVEHKHAITDPGHNHGGATGGQSQSHTHDLPNVGGVFTDCGIACGTLDAGTTTTTSSASNDHTHSITSGTTGITETDNGNGVAAASQLEYMPHHYVINYIIYKGPLGA